MQIHLDPEPAYGIRAVFCAEGKPDTYTHYSETQFETIGDALDAIEGDLGEQLLDAATLDSKIEPDLAGYYLSDLEPYLIKGGA
jgi:hypothetical protein